MKIYILINICTDILFCYFSCNSWKLQATKKSINRWKINFWSIHTSWQIDRKTMETVTDYFGGLQITADADCIHDIKRHLLLGRKAMTNLDSVLKKQRHHFANKGLYSQCYSFSNSHVQMWERTIKKGEHQRIDAFALWCWRILLRVPWTSQRSNKSILKEINPQYSLEGLLL